MLINYYNTSFEAVIILYINILSLDVSMAKIIKKIYLYRFSEKNYIYNKKKSYYKSNSCRTVRTTVVVQ